MLEKYERLRNFVGAKALNYYWLSAMVGTLWFLIETSFIFLMQGFLFSIGLLNKQQVFLPSWYPTSLSSSVILLILFGMIRAVVYMLKNYYANLTLISFNCDQRSRLLSFGLKYPHLISSKELIVMFTEITTQSGTVIYNTSNLINTGLSASLFFFMGLKLAPYEMIIGISLLGLFLYPLRFLTMRIDGLGRELMKEWENLSESLLRGLKNNFLLLIYNQVEPEIIKGDVSLNKYKSHYMKYTVVAGFVSAFPLLIGVVILSLITFMSVRFIKTDPVKLISFFYIFIRLAQASSEANGTLSNLKLNLPGLKRLFAWGERYSSVVDKEAGKPTMVIDTPKVDIEVVDLSFNFEGRKALFENLNFKISRSEMLIIKGKSGVGKSTLLSLILGLRVPTTGEVKISSHSSRSFAFDFHNVLAYVGPEPYLVEGTVRENLIYGLDKNVVVSDDSLWANLKVMELDDLVMALPLKLDAKVDEIPQLSTGQRQRLAFARALVRKPSLLILDEATANLDSETEHKIISNLQNIFQQCTCIIVTHKNSFDAYATHALSLQPGASTT